MEGRSLERRKGAGGLLYTSVSDVLNTVSKGRRSILAHSITSAVKSLVHALIATSITVRLQLLEFLKSVISLYFKVKDLEGNCFEIVCRFKTEMLT